MRWREILRGRHFSHGDNFQGNIFIETCFSFIYCAVRGYTVTVKHFMSGVVFQQPAAPHFSAEALPRPVQYLTCKTAHENVAYALSFF